MLLIFCEHLGYAVSPFVYTSSVSFELFLSLTQVGIPCFILLLGYQTIRLRLDHFFSLLLQMLFYSFIFSGLTYVLGYHSYSVRDFWHALVPVCFRPYGLMTAYLLLFLLAPFLNKATLRLSRVASLVMLLGGFVSFYVWPALHRLPALCDGLQFEGYRLVQFVYLYLLGRYFRLYSLFIHRPAYYLTWFVVCILLLTGHHLYLSERGETALLSSYAPAVLFAAITLFFSFVQLRFRSRLVHRLSTAVPAVYLVFFAPYVLTMVTRTFSVLAETDGLWLCVKVLAVSCVVFLCGFVIEQLRLVCCGTAERQLIRALQKVPFIQRILARYLTWTR